RLAFSRGFQCGEFRLAQTHGYRQAGDGRTRLAACAIQGTLLVERARQDGPGFRRTLSVGVVAVPRTDRHAGPADQFGRRTACPAVAAGFYIRACEATAGATRTHAARPVEDGDGGASVELLARPYLDARFAQLLRAGRPAALRRLRSGPPRQRPFLRRAHLADGAGDVERRGGDRAALRR